MEEIKKENLRKENLNEAKKEFISAYKDSDEEKHLLKLFDKTGEEIIEPTDNDDNKWFDELKLRIKCFFQEALKLDTVSFLFGTGSSMPLGAESICKIPAVICSIIKKKGLENIHKRIKSCHKEANNEDMNLEEYLGNLVRLKNVINKFGSTKGIIKFHEDSDIKINGVSSLIETVKKGLFDICNVPNVERIKDSFYKNDSLKVHKEFIKKILARPVNLKRVSIFTTNYDTVFENAMDELGVIYIDGFVGSIRRIFKPEVYNYDYYFPASTTEGRVHRLDKVIHLYKLHGSLNWLECTPDAKNIFGIEQTRGTVKYNKGILIYPQPMKEEETLGFPYSEMFRRFANVIQQPQNVLIVYGYGFGDEHVNRVIFNALSISTFQLVVISYDWAPKLKEFYEKIREDPRISFLIGRYLGDWRNLVTNLLPDVKQLELEGKILETMKKLRGKDKEEEETNGK